MISSVKIVNNINHKIALFLINPFLSAIYSFLHIKERGSLTLLYCWFLIFGIGFCAVGESMDSYRYVEKFTYECRYTWNFYINDLKEWYSLSGDIKDIYRLSVNFLVGTFSYNYHWTYLIYASVFGFFYIKSLKIFIREEVCERWLFLALLFMFCISNPIFNINGARFYTSAWIGVFAALKVFVEHKNRYLLLLLLMPLVHGSSVIWAFLVLIAFFTCRYQSAWIVLFVVSSFVSAVSYLDVLNDYSYLLPPIFQDQVDAYTQSDEAIAKMNGEENISIYTKIFRSLPSYFHLMLTYLLIINRRFINMDSDRKYLFSAFLALMAMVNFLSVIPSVWRLQYLVVPILVIVWAQNYTYMMRYKRLFYFIPIIYFFSLFLWFNRMATVTEIYLYVFPAPLTILKYLLFI